MIRPRISTGALIISTVVAKALKVTKPTVRACLNALFDLKLVERDTDGKAYVYRKAPENFGDQHD